MGTAPSVLQKFKTAETQITEELRRISLPLLRCAFGIVFIWFGALKVVGASPVGDFVAGTLPWFDKSWLVPALGLFEVAIGLAMIAGRHLFLVCIALVAHLIGTFLALIMESALSFQNGNPLLLATDGEFVVKNLVLIAAALVLAARFDRSH
jgi:putative oxidoreductase